MTNSSRRSSRRSLARDYISRMSASLDELDDRHVWTLEGHRITQVCVDLSSCRLQSWSLQSSLEIRFGVPFRLALVDGTRREIDPEQPEQVAPLLTLVSRELLQLVVTKDGSIEARMSDGSVLSADSHRRHEAFAVSGG